MGGEYGPNGRRGNREEPVDWKFVCPFQQRPNSQSGDNQPSKLCQEERTFSSIEILNEHLELVHSEQDFCVLCKKPYPIVPDIYLRLLEKEHEDSCKGRKDRSTYGGRSGMGGAEMRTAVRMTSDQVARWKKWMTTYVPMIPGESKQEMSWRQIYKSFYPDAQTIPSMFPDDDPRSGHMGDSGVVKADVEAPYINFEDSALFSDNHSIHSASVSDAAVLNSIKGVVAGSPNQIQKIQALLCEDGVLMNLCTYAIATGGVEFERLRNHFRKLLRLYAEDLKAEATDDRHWSTVEFVRSWATRITQTMFQASPLRTMMTKLQLSDRSKSNSRSERRRRVEEYLRNSYAGGGETRQENERSEHDSDDDTDQDLSDEEPCHGPLENLDQIQSFMLDGVAYSKLHRRLYDFVFPTLEAKLEALVAVWTKPGHRYHSLLAQHRIPALVSELRYNDPLKIWIDHFDEDHLTMSHRIGNCQGAIERWTGERWDWWPLPRFHQPLKEGEARVRWKCTCEQERWATVPTPFAVRLQSIINTLSESIRSPQHAEGAHAQGSPGVVSHGIPLGNRPIVQAKGQRQQRLDSASSIGPHLGPPRSDNGQSGLPHVDQRRVLLIVKRGSQYKLSQIETIGHNNSTFFSSLKADYFLLRGFFRRWFSVWRYSHCDFYRFLKFDAYEMAPRKKDDFPPVTHYGYEYRPRPMDLIPPLCEHEFEKRFYACHHPKSSLYWYHKCRRLGAQSRDILMVLPQKKTRLEEGGDAREDFWGLYARERVSLCIVLLYNFLCILPLLVFFVARVVPFGLGGDWQSPAVPMSTMIAMLSLFWSVYFASLQSSRAH